MLKFLLNKIKNKYLLALVEIVSSLIIMVGLTLLVYFGKIPNPNMILITGLIISSAMFGICGGVVSGLEIIIYSWFFFSKDKKFFSLNFTQENSFKLIVIVVGVVVSVAVIGYLTFVQGKLYKRIMDNNKQLKDDNDKLVEATIKDSLTSTRNRFAFKNDRDSYIGREIFLMIIDIDDFKSVNDYHGHESGDKALVTLSSSLKEIFGEEYCYRFGGDEFIVISLESSKEQFEHNINRLKNDIKSFSIENSEIGINFSAGYVHGVVSVDDDFRFMIAQADELLYKAKREGKNTFFGEEFSQDIVEEKRNKKK